MKKRMSWLIINLLILLSELSTCSCFDEPEGLPKAVLATSYTDGACTIREEVNDTRDGTICHILGKCYSIINGVWDDEAGLMYAVYGFLPVSSTKRWQFTQTIYWDNACTWQELPKGFSVMSFPCDLDSCCPTVVASNLNEPYQPQSAPEDYVWKYVKYTFASSGECPDDVFTDGDIQAIGTNSNSMPMSKSYTSSSRLNKYLYRLFLFLSISSIVAVITIIYEQKLRNLYSRMTGSVVTKDVGDNEKGTYEIVLGDGFEGVDNVPALWARTVS